jgi:hypothetical protein
MHVESSGLGVQGLLPDWSLQVFQDGGVKGRDAVGSWGLFSEQVWIFFKF